MIQMACMYCGQPIPTEEAPVFRRIECPGCRRSIPVPARKPDAGRAAPAEREDWTGKSNEEIAEQLLTPKPTKEQLRREAMKMALSPLLPRYDDLTLFALSLSFLLLWLIDEGLRREWPLAVSLTLGRYSVLMIAAGFGMACSLVNVFLAREKSRLEKRAMLWFAVCVTAVTGIYAGRLSLAESQGWLIIFPAWNVLNGALLLLLTRAGVIDTDCIVDEQATFNQILITAVVVPILLTVCLYVFELHWATTFSIAAGYTMTLHHALDHLFSKRRPAPAQAECR